MLRLSHLTLAVCLLAGAPFAAVQAAPATAASQQDLAAQLDAMMAPYFKANEPGGAVIVAKDGKVLLRKAYGMANLDAGVPLAPDTVFRLGSITKQFTAVAIMMLADEGKLAVSDPITKYLPQMPEKGVTIEHLLTHTSGVVSYTSKPNFAATAIKDLTVNEMIDSFRNDPLEFAPGSRFNYSNSGYFLLGAIIEKVSGQSYAAFLQQRIFKPLGMQHTGYGDTEPAGLARAVGYTRKDGKIVPANPLSMSQPYAAGSLTSNVDDLLLWDNAVRTGKLLKAESWKRVYSPYKMSSGEVSNYAYGWGVGSLKGHASAAHSGGINGFSTNAVRLRDDGVFVAILTNAEYPVAPLGMLSNKAAALAVGDPYTDFKRISLSNEQLDAFTGTFKIDDKTTRVIRREGDGLTMQRSGGGRVKIWPHGPNAFHLENSLAYLEFGRDASGKVTQLTMVQDDGSSAVQARIGDAPAEAKTVVVDKAVFDKYVGRYELAPGFILEVSRDGDKFMTQATGQGKFEIFAKSETEFFPKVVDATLTFEKDADGKVVSLTLRQGGRTMPAKRLN